VDLGRERSVTPRSAADTAKVLVSHAPLQGLLSVGVLALALILLFYRLGDGSLYDWDEAIYAQVAKEVALSDNWMSLSWNGSPFFHKPPLYFWLTALTYKLMGISEFAARLWPASFGFGVIALTFVLGLRLGSWPVGAIAALLLLVVDQAYYGYWWNFLSLARVGMLETGVTFWMMTALFLVWEAAHRPRLIILIGLSTGMAVMTKAWPGLFAAGIAFLYWLIAGEHRRDYAAYWLMAALLAGLLILPWHLWEFAMHGSPFVHDYIGVNLSGRLFGAFEGHSGSPLDYVDILRRGFSVWAYACPLAYVWAVWRATTRGDRRLRLLLVWITLPLVAFSMAQTKLGWYISMIYPAITLLLGLALVELFTERWAPGLVAALMLVCCLRLPPLADGSGDVKLFALQAAQSVIQGEPVYVSQPTCTDHAPAFSVDTPALEVGIVRPSLLFYMDRPLVCIEDRQIQSGLHPRHAYVISPQASWGRIGHSAGVVLEAEGFVLARWD
jgi:4-amino-4-deoxy-L-arabinose transferase-like glycosyltransferase